jgi:hypothetical protein
MRHIKVENSQFSLDHNSQIIELTDEMEDKLIVGETSYLVRLIMNSHKTRSMNSIIKGLLHYTGGHKPRVDEIFKALNVALREFDYDRLKPFYYLFENMLLSNFEYFE